MIWNWLKYQVLPPARIGQAAGGPGPVRWVLIICSFQEHQDQLIQGSYNSSKGVRKERRKGRKPTRVRKLTVLRPSGGRRQGLTFPRKTLRSSRLAWPRRQDHQRHWSSWDEDVWLCAGTRSPLLMSVPSPMQAMPSDLGPDWCQ